MGKNESEIELTVVVLAYRAGAYIQQFVQQLFSEIQPLQVSCEFIIVANYDDDTDQTPAIVHEHFSNDPHFIIISQHKQGRMGWDMRSGLQHARGKYVAIIDGDGQMPVSDITTVYNIIRQGSFDLVYTYRAKRYDGMYRQVLSTGYNFLFTLLFWPSVKLRDINSKPKIMTTEALHKINLISNDWFTDTEIVLEALRLNLRICQVATVFSKNERRKSFVGFTTIFEFIYNLFYYRLFKQHNES